LRALPVKWIRQFVRFMATHAHHPVIRSTSFAEKKLCAARMKTVAVELGHRRHHHHLCAKELVQVTVEQLRNTA